MTETNNTIVTFLGQMGKIETLVDGSIKIQFLTQEMSGDEIAEVLQYRNKMVYVIVGEDTINEIPRQVGEKLKKQMAATGKGTPSENLRKALYLSWKANAEINGAMKFEEYYELKMEEWVAFIYNKLDESKNKA